MKKNLLLLLTVLFSLCTTNAWGAEYTLVTSIDDLSNGDKVIIATKTNNVPSSGVTGGTVQSSTSTKKDATVSSTESSWMQFTVTKTTEGWYLSNASSQYIGKPTDNTFYLTETTNCKGVCSVNSNGVLCCNNRYLQKNSTYYRMYGSINNSYTPFYVWKVTASCTAITPTLTYSPSTLDIGDTSSPKLTGNTGSGTVTYLSNNTSVATVDASTGVVTAVSAGTATITANIAANGDYCSGSATATITVNKKSATVTLSEAGATTSVTGKYVGNSYTLPSTTSQSCGDKTFVGWSTTTITNSATKPTTNFYEPGASVTLSANQTFYAVFATTSGGGSTSTPYKFTISASNFNTTSYDANNNEKTSTATATDGSGSTFSVKWTSNQVMKGTGDNSSNMQWQKSKGYIYNSTDLGTIDSVAITSSAGKYTTYYGTSEQPSSGTTVGNGYFKISVGSVTGYASKIEITFTKTTGTTTTYSDYTTECSTETSPLATPDDLDATDITSTSAILSWTAVANADKYRVTINGKTIDVDDNTTYTATELTANTSYTWTVTALSDGTDYSDSETASHTFTTLAAASDPYTVNFIAGSGTCTTTSLTEASGGAGVTLPTASPSDACKEEGWTFAGWAEASVATETTTAPATLLAAGDTYNPTANCVLYAVYSITETGSGGSGDYELVTLAPTDWSGTYLIVNTDDKKAWKGSAISDNNAIDVTITDNTIVSEATTDAETFTIAKMTGGYSICGTSGKYISGTSGDNTTNYGDSAALNTISIDEDNNVTITSNTSVLRQNNSSSSLFRYYKSSTYSSQHPIQLYRKSAGSSTTYYHSTPSCVPIYSITYDFAGGTGSHCSNTSVPQGDPYTICDEEPTKEGYTFQGWSDGTSTYAAGATITPEDDITLTAQWQIKTYTVIWSVNGGATTTLVTYEHGDDLTLPSAPESCDGVKEFVGWTEDNTFTYHTTTPPSDLFKTTTATVTADKTYYAVFATKGAGGTEFVLGESGTFKMYANVNGTNYYAQGGVSSSQITSTTNALSASDYTLTYANGSYTIKQGKSDIGHSSSTSLSSTSSTWTISEGTNGSWRVQSNKDESRALSYSSSANAFKAYATSNITAGDDTYFDIEFGTGSSGYSDYTTTCQPVDSIEVQSPKTEFYLTDDFTIGTGKVIATFSGGGTTDVTGDAHFSGYNMEATGTQIVTVTYMGATATYEITVKPRDDAWVLTWNVSGKTNTGLGPRCVTKGSAIGTLPTPEVPAACAGKTFMGWTESNIVPSDGKGIVYITEATVPSKNTTYYAVFATINNFCTQKPIDQIASGSKVVIVAVASLTDDGGAGKAISSRATDDTYNLQGDDVAIYDQTINTPHSTCIWTITKSGEKYIFTQDGKYLNGIIDGSYSNLKYNSTSDSWSLSDAASGMAMTYNMKSTNASTEYVEWYNGKFTIHNEVNTNGAFDMQFFVTANADGNADITDYTTGCAEYTITYYGFHGGYSTSCSSDGTIVLPVNSIHTVPDCEGLVINDHTNLGREFLNVWMTQPHGGHTFKPGDTFILTQDTTLYAQWKMETTSDVTTLPTDIEDLAGTDIYVYGGTTLNIQPGTTTINSLTLKGGLQADGSYKMPTVWVPEGATLVRNSNKINLDLIVNAKTYYPFAVPFAAKNNANVEYLDPVLAAASTYGTHFAIKTYDGARRAEVGEDKTNNWVRVLREETLQPGVGYIITALTYPDKDTATIRIPMTVPNTWFQNGEQAEVGTTVRNTIAVTAHAGAAATEHQRHAGWNFVANPYLTSFAGGNVANDGGLAYINGELIIEGSYEYTDEEVPYVTVPAYDFAYYSQHKLSDVKLSPEWSFFVQVGTGGTMNFTTAGRQQAPASIAARNAEERPVKMDVDLILSDNHSSDQTGLIICDRYTDAYEIGRDLEKLFGSAYNLSVYTLMEDNTPLAFQALAIRSSMQVIPVGYRAPEQGEYTFRLNEATSSIDLLNEQYEQLVLVDYQTGELTNLLYTDYTFYSERTQSNSRFAIYAVPRQNAPTDLPNAIGSDEEVRKVIYNDHLYILRDGNVYNGMGQKM